MKNTNILVLGANGAIARHVIGFLLESGQYRLTLLARNSEHIQEYAPVAKIIEGDVLNRKDLDHALEGQDIVYANLSSPVDKMAKAIIDVMNRNRVNRLLFVSSLGIHNEVVGEFGKWNEMMIGSSLKPYRRAAEIIEGSTLAYTIVRPSWLTNKDETEYETTRKGEPFRGTEVSRKAVAAYIADIIENPEKDIRESIGVNKPGVYGDKPSFY